VLHELTIAALHTGWPGAAQAALIEALEIVRESVDASGLPLFLGDFADLALAGGDRERAMRLRGAAAAMEDLTGAALESASRLYNARYEIEPGQPSKRAVHSPIAAATSGHVRSASPSSRRR
jgi:hypothetical protein